MGKFDGKIAVVVGAGSGIGKEVARELLKNNAVVIGADINIEACERSMKELRKELPNAEISSAAVDITDRDSCEELARGVAEKYGRIDLLSHCAGVLTNGPIEELPEEEIDFVFNVNLKGALHTLQAFGKRMVDQGKGKICLIASKAGKIGTPTLAHYSASKFGVIGLVQTAAMEWGRKGVYVNCVCPGEVDTPMLRKSYEKICNIEGITMEEQLRRGNEMSLVGRISPPENVAKIIVFLLSDDSDEIMGQAINADGGIIFH